MIKYLKRLLFAFAVVLLMPQLVFAGTYTCDTKTYTVSKTDSVVLKLNGGDYTLNFYNASRNGGSVKAFCLDPGRQGPKGVAYACDEVIDLTGQTVGVGSLRHALYIAMARAYYKLSIDGPNDSTANGRAVGELVFRWLMFNYQAGDEKNNGFKGAQQAHAYFVMDYGGVLNKYWNGITDTNTASIVNMARPIFEDAKRVGDKVLHGSTYDQLVSAEELPNEKFQYEVNVEEDPSMGGRRMYRVHFTSTPSDSTVFWGDFEPSIEGGSIEEFSREDESTFIIKARVPSSGTYKLTLKAKYWKKGSLITNMRILKSTGSTELQRMLIAADTNDSGTARTVIKGGQDIPLNEERCTPDGTQVCKYNEDGSIASCRPAEPGECGENPGKKTCSSENGVYYGIAGTVVTPLVFYDECCESGQLTDEEYDKYCPCGHPDINYIGQCSEFNSDSDVVNTVKDTKDNAHLKTCLFNNASTDAAGNTVRMSDQESVSGNPYCKVGCIEEYEFTLPNAQYTTSGGYFSLSSQIKGTRKCYANAADSSKFNGIDHELFVKDLFEASKTLASAQSTYNQLKGALENIKMDTKNGCAEVDMYWNDEYKYKSYSVSISGNNISLSEEEITMERNHWLDGSGGKEDSSGKCHGGHDGTEDGLKEKILGTTGSGDNKKTKSLSDYAEAITRAEAKIQSILKQYDNCFSWNNNFKFDPKIHFDYDEPYNEMKDFEHLFSEVRRDATTSDGYCNNTDSSYNCSGSSSTYAQSYITCSGGKCSSTTKDVISQVYLRKEASVLATYQPKNEFSVYTPLGTITFNKDKGLYTVLCKENDCLPVSLNATTGVFNFEFKFSNIGQYNDSNTLGRLMGGSNNVFETKGLEAGYVCQYVNNCPECDYTCVGDKCDIDPDPECPDCPYVCQNCVFDGSENTYFYRTVSVNNLFPNTKTRDVGPNWNTSKGTETKKAIQDSGESVYSTPEYSYTITPNQMKRIREYNNSVGGYLNATTPNGDDALTCYDKNGYENVYCTSAFLDTTGNTYFTQNVRSDQWTLWGGSITDGVGPAWK